MEKRIIKTSSIEELLSILEKDYGPTWYDKITLQITETTGQIEAIIKPIENVDSKTPIDISSVKIKPVSLPDLSSIEQQYSQPIIKVNISDDKMRASIFIIPGFERISPTVDEIKQALSNSKVVYGIDEKSILSAIEKQKLFTEIVVAQGKKPVPSKDASIEFLFPSTGFLYEKPQEDERFDPASLYKIFTCKAGDVLAVKKPAQYGQDGMTVTGEIIKVNKPKDINLSSFLGQNVTVSEDNLKILAACDGQPYLKDSKVNVRNVLVIDKDLGYDIGNIDFNASVVIRGNAEGPFKIRAGGDVLILGILGEVQVTCGGSLRVQGGVFGRSKGIINVAKDFAAKFINEAQIFCGGNILVEDYIMNSTLICAGDIKVFGKGVISGGTLKVAGNIEASELGSIANIRTEIIAGIDYEHESKYIQLQKSLIEIMKQINILSNTENSIRNQLSQTKDISKRESLKILLQKTQQAKFAFEKQLHRIRNAINIMKHNIQIDKLKFGAKIRVRRICHANVKIGIGLVSRLNSEELGPCEFFLDKSTGEIECKSNLD